jgi:hypothetical protein
VQTPLGIDSSPPRGLRPIAMAVGSAVSALGGWAVLAKYDLGTPPGQPADPAAAWGLVQCLAGVWSGVLGAGSPLMHGLVAGIPAFALGAALGHTLPIHFDALTYFLAPTAAVVAAAVMRYSARTRPG